MIRGIFCKLALWDGRLNTDKFLPESILLPAEPFIYFKRVPWEETGVSTLLGIEKALYAPKSNGG